MTALALIAAGTAILLGVVGAAYSEKCYGLMIELWLRFVIALKAIVLFYGSVGVIYGGWVFVLLIWRRGCASGSECIPVLTPLVTGAVAVCRGIFWPVDMTVAILRGTFLDWLFLLNFFDARVGMIEHFMLKAIGLI